MDRNLLDYRDYRASTSWEDLLAEENKDKRPWKKVALAVFLCLGGAIMLSTGLILWYQSSARDVGRCLGVHLRPQAGTSTHAASLHSPNSRCFRRSTCCNSLHPLPQHYHPRTYPSFCRRIQQDSINMVACTAALVVHTVCAVVHAALALLVLGSICFLPGFYHTRIAYLSWKGVSGYSLNDIPDM